MYKDVVEVTYLFYLNGDKPWIASTTNYAGNHLYKYNTWLFVEDIDAQIEKDILDIEEIYEDELISDIQIQFGNQFKQYFQR